ncbi:MAG: AraC family transcriptional regulator [Cyanobacteria bacterium P01_F01_bin.86]
MQQDAKVSVQAWGADGILLEHYAYTAGKVEPLPKHAHVEYQLGLSYDCQGEYTYRGARYAISKGSLSIIHSGEMHAPSDRTSLLHPANFVMAHITPSCFHTIAAAIAAKSTSLPFFPVHITDPQLNCLFLDLKAVIRKRATQLEQDTALENFLTCLIGRHATNQSALQPVASAHTAIKRARDYLHAHYAEDISLADLAAIAHLSRFHFCRLFSREVGVSPSTYQTQLRIAQAKKLLAQGLSILTVATVTGFYDQSHFGRTFKRQVGTTPSNYVSQTAIFS